MSVLTITAGTLPQNFAVVTWQEVLDAFADYMTVDFTETVKTYVIGPNTPDPADQDKIWFEVDGAGAPVNVNVWNASAIPAAWESFINPASYAKGSLIGFDALGNQIEIPVGADGQYVGTDGTDFLWKTFDPLFSNTAGRLVFFSAGSPGYFNPGTNPIPGVTGHQVDFGTFDQPTGLYQLLLIPQMGKGHSAHTSTLSFTMGGVELRSLNFASFNGDGDSSFSYTHAFENNLTNLEPLSLKTTGETRLLAAQLMIFQK